MPGSIVRCLQYAGPSGRELCTGSHCNSASSYSCSSCWQKCGTSVLHRLWQGAAAWNMHHVLYNLWLAGDQMAHVHLYGSSGLPIAGSCCKSSACCLTLPPQLQTQQMQRSSRADFWMSSMIGDWLTKCMYVSELILLYDVQTLAYLLPVLGQAIQRAEEEFRMLQQQGKAHEAGKLQALVVVPSRELAMQIVRVAQGLIAPEARATIQQCIGGANPHRQVEHFRSECCWCCACLLAPSTCICYIGLYVVLAGGCRAGSHSCVNE